MLLVSIHDVTPAFEPRVLQLWDLCSSHGVTPALFVVPNWHGTWPLEAHPGFVRWIRSRAGQGAEVVLHGERHDEVGLYRSRRDSWRAWGNTAEEGEFLTLDAPAARQRLYRALDQVRQVGLEPSGFVPPAWLARESTYEVAGSAGLRFSEDAGSVILLPSRYRVDSPVVRWSARTSFRAWGSIAVGGARWLLQRGSPWPRIALHPQDLNHPATAGSLRPTLERWLRKHRSGRYADLTTSFQAA
ncbi:MAG TPA: polysaccharide deacetylase family protein [Gemmatimonadales bacterium]|nr:polysaccharide deacetylase family protein [Gemmatimonadales bacterium]